jgi:hypothetical protein
MIGGASRAFFCRSGSTLRAWCVGKVVQRDAHTMGMQQVALLAVLWHDGSSGARQLCARTACTPWPTDTPLGRWLHVHGMIFRSRSSSPAKRKRATGASQIAMFILSQVQSFSMNTLMIYSCYVHICNTSQDFEFNTRDMMTRSRMEQRNE